LIAYSALFSCLLGKQLLSDHFGGDIFCFFWTRIKEVQNVTKKLLEKKKQHKTKSYLIFVILRLIIKTLILN